MKRTVSAGLLGVVALSAALLVACQPANTGSAIQPTASPVRLPKSSPSATPTPAAPVLAVDKVGAVATPGGFLAFAVLSNPSTQMASDVKVQISAVAANGRVLTQRTGTLRHMSPNQREAVAVPFPVGASLPAQFTGRVISVQWSADGEPDAAQVAGTRFLQDARTPSVRVHLVNSGPSAARLAVTAVCWDGAGNIRGGGSQTVTVGPNPQGHDVTIQVAISTIPARCDAFGTTS
jgi:hypothetical protein